MQTLKGDFRSVPRFSTYMVEQKNVHMEHL